MADLDHALIEDQADIDALRRAARVLRRRGRKPDGLFPTMLRRVLTDLSDVIEDELEAHTHVETTSFGHDPKTYRGFE